MDTYNNIYIVVGKVEVGECLQVIWEGEAPLLFEVVARFSNQLCCQMHHDGSSRHLVVEEGSF